MTEPRAVRSRDDLDALAASGQHTLRGEQTRVLVGRASCGKAAGADAVFDALEAALDEAAGISVGTTGCLGFCAREPLVEVVHPDGRGIVYENVTAEDATTLAAALENATEPTGLSVLGTRSHDGGEPDGIELPDDPFFAGQERVILRNAGTIDPGSLAEYVATGGYRPLVSAITERSPEAIVEAVTASNLRGRGGAGFPTGVKWRFARDAEGEETYVICNAKGGDPGSYMDRSILESDPFAVLEGLTIAGYAVGAESGIVYVHAEYPLAVRRLEAAAAAAREVGLLGEGILGTDFDFEVRIERGSSAFVAGEETALINAIESGRAEPETKPPFPAQSGLYGQPTVINNVETLAAVPPIIEHGPDWFDDLGVGDQSGTKVFSLTGTLENTGLVEVPMGTTIGDLVYEFGDVDPESVKAVQTGGPAGGCIPPAEFDTPLDYESLASVGSIMGSGGLIVVDEDTCMVDLARHFLSFTQAETCGKCTPCRVGTKHMLDVLDALAEGRATPDDIDRLEALGEYVAESSLCGLGIAAPTPVESTLEYFREEYDAHLAGECPTGVCSMDAGADVTEPGVGR